jgi:hypothetical protein
MGNKMNLDIENGVITRAKNIQDIPLEDIRPNPKNRNNHSKDQIDRLAKIIKYQGFRSPLIVSKRSGLLVSGHGRLQAAQQLKMSHVPVIFQDFDSEEQEYAALISENSIASWAELDLSGINIDIGDFGPELDLDMLGLKQFTVTPEFEPGSENDQGKLDEKKPVVTQCPNCGECFDANENKPKN